jgi:glycosyltransferase involved in cell wall biosynthesis
MADVPVSLIVANNMVMENETAHVLQTCQMLAAFAEIGCAVTYLWPSFGRTVPLLAGLPVTLAPVPCRARHGKARYAEFVARLLPRLHRLSHRCGPGSQPVVFSRSLGVALAAQLVAPRVVVEVHNDFSPIARLGVPLTGSRLRWVAISGSLRDHLIQGYGFPAAHVAACHDAVDYLRFAQAEPLPAAERPLPPAPGVGPLHLYYGTLRPERGLALIAEAARALPGHGFVLIGGSDAEATAARALPGLDQSNVLVRPAVPHNQIPRLIRSYDSVLLPYTRAVATHRWMSPLKLFEVMASGTPAVVSRLGPLAEVVDDDTATFIDIDRPNSLSEALTALATAPDAARHRAAAAQRLAHDHHTWTARARAIVALGVG